MNAETPLCGRPTRYTGAGCKSRRHPPEFFDPEMWMPPACIRHLTDDEVLQRRASTARSAECERNMRSPRSGSVPPTPAVADVTGGERAALLAAAEQRRAARERLSREPDCWSWPIPEIPTLTTEDDHGDALFLFQQGHGCAICSDGDRLVNDHDHQTGLVRGQLCRACNTREGKGNETEPFVKYRQRPPALIIGVRVVYWSSFTGYAEPAPEPMSADVLRAAVGRLQMPDVNELAEAGTAGPGTLGEGDYDYGR